MSNINISIKKQLYNKIILISLKVLTLFIALFVNKYVLDFRIDQIMILKLSSIFLALFLLTKAITIKEIIFNKNDLIFPIFLFILLISLSLILSQNKTISFQDYVTLISYFFIFFLVTNYIDSQHQIESFIKIFFITSSIVSLYTIIQYYNIDPYLRNLTSLTSTIGLKNWISNYIGMFFPIAFIFFLIKNNKKNKTIYYFLLSIFYITLMICQSRGIWISISLTLIFAIYIIFRFRLFKIFQENRKWLILLLATILIITIVYSTDNPLNKSIITVPQRALSTFDENDPSINTRLLIWETTINMIKEKPLLGSGIGTFKMNYLDYQAELLKNKPYYIKYSVKAGEVHNEYLQMAAEIGIIGLSIFLIIIFMLYKLVWISLNAKIDELKKLKLLGMILGISCFLIHSLFAFPLHVPVLGTSFFILFGLTVTYAKNIDYSNQFKRKTNNYFKLKLQIIKSNKLKTIFIVFIMILFLFLVDIWVLKPYIAEIYYFKGIKNYSKKNYVEALNNLEYAVKLNPKNGRILNALGTIYLNFNKLNEAEIVLKIAKKYRNDPVIYYNLGLVYMSEKLYRNAEYEFKQSIYYMPKYFISYVELAKLYDIQKDYDKEISIWEKTLEIEPNISEKPIIIYCIGMAYNKKQMPDKALEYFLQALQLAPEGSPIIEEIEEELYNIYKSKLEN